MVKTGSGDDVAASPAKGTSSSSKGYSGCQLSSVVWSRASVRPMRAGEMLSNTKRSVSIFLGVQYSRSNTLTPDSALFEGARGKFRLTFRLRTVLPVGIWPLLQLRTIRLLRQVPSNRNIVRIRFCVQTVLCTFIWGCYISLSDRSFWTRN